jgi:hypothetical protein
MNPDTDRSYASWRSPVEREAFTFGSDAVSDNGNLPMPELSAG